MAQQQVFRPPVDVLAVEFDAEPRPADLQAPVRLGEVPVAGAAGGPAGALVDDDEDGPSSGGLVAQHLVEERVEVGVGLDSGDEVVPYAVVERDLAQRFPVGFADRVQFYAVVLEDGGSGPAPCGLVQRCHPFRAA
ncbi:hypothetical protein GCM10029992_25180 [Glycomyces albus]